MFFFQQRNPLQRVSIIFLAHLLVFTNLSIPTIVHAQSLPSNILNLPSPGTVVSNSPKFSPAMMTGVTLHPENPLQFDFIINTGEDRLQGEEFKKEAMKLIKYFLVSLTVPEKDLWVNLSPYEKDRIIPETFGITEMGRDLLAQDYLLKQLTASLTSPESGLGKDFWSRVYAKAQKLYGTSNIPVNTFNKVWIAPDKAVVYEHNGSAFVTQSHLRVLLEKDYLAISKNTNNVGAGLVPAQNNRATTRVAPTDVNQIGSQIVREIVIPAIETEVNEGKNFVQIRQVFNSMILATWYKKRLKETLLSQVFVNKNKIKGIDLNDKQMKQKIYEQYLKAFKKGVSNYIKEELDPATGQMIPRKYFSGGVGVGVVTVNNLVVKTASSPAMIAEINKAGNNAMTVTANLVENQAAGSDLLTSMVARAPTAERSSWEARRRDRPNVSPEGVGTVSYEQFFSTELPVEQQDNVRLIANLHHQGHEFLRQNFQGNLPQPNTTQTEVVVVENYEGLLGLENGKIYADLTLASRMGLKAGEPANEGLQLLSALNQLYILYRLEGRNAREVLDKVLDFYEHVQKTKPEVVTALHQALRGEIVDSDNLFSFFLNKATGPVKTSSATDGIKAKEEYREGAQGWFDALYQATTGQAFTGERPASLPSTGERMDEITAKNRQDWRQRWIVWFLGQRDFDAPVDLEQADAILSSDASKDEQAQQLLELVDKKYDSENERRNAKRKLFQLLENNQSLSVSRFGRASYFLMLLAAASRFLTDIQGIEKIVADLEKFLQEQVPGIKDQAYGDLVKEIRSQTAVLNKYLLDIRVAIQPGRNVSHAELKGKVEKLEEAIRQYSDTALGKLAEFASRTGKRTNLSTLRNFITKLTFNMSNMADQLLSTIDAMPGDRTNFSVLIQRSSKTGTRNLNLVRLGDDPFGGGEHLIAEAYREGGDMTYGSSDDIWFEFAQYWIEALPLMIHEEKVELENGQEITKLVIEQEGMELALRSIAPKFKNNLDNVMDSEHVDIARVLIAKNDPRFKADFETYKQQNAQATEEEAALAVLRKFMNAQKGEQQGQLEREIASVAALIDGTWHNLREQVADIQEKDKLLRYNALKKLLEFDTSNLNLFYLLISRVQEGSSILQAANFLIGSIDEQSNQRPNGSSFRLAPTRDSLIKADLPYMKRREIPTWIILTTQAPGMSDAFAGHWVDEEMSLVNVTNGFTYNGRSLDQEARDLARDYESRIHDVAKRLIGEFQLEYRIKEMIARGEVRDERAAINKLINDYSDLAREVAKVFMLYEATPLADGQEKHDYSREPKVIEDYIAKNKDRLAAVALQRVIQENAELRSAATIDTSIYQSEIDKYIRVLARDEVIEGVKATDEKLYNLFKNLLTPLSDKSLPPILASRLLSKKGMTTARQEVLARYWLNEDGSIIPIEDVKDKKSGKPLFLAQNDALYSYAATGRNKKYNRGYGPSRVDLGNEERRSTEKWAQWIGPADAWAKAAMKEFYQKYNMDVRAYDDVREGETMKPLENSLMEASLALTHLYIGLFQAVGAGNLMNLIYETNSRPETFVRTGGAGSSGFCQPKDIYFPIFVSTTAQNEILKYAGVSPRDWPLVNEVRRVLVKALKQGKTPSESEAAVKDLLLQRLAEQEASVDAKVAKAKGSLGPNTFSLSGISLPPATSIVANDRIGEGDPQSNPRRFIDTLIAGYYGEVVAQLEGRNRFAPVQVLSMLKSAFLDAKNARGKDSEISSWEKAILSLPMEYKPVSDARLAVGLRMLEFLALIGDPHLTNTFGADGEQLYKFLLFGFDPNNEQMREFFERKAREAGNTQEQIEEIIVGLTTTYPKTTGVGDVRMYSPFNLAADAIYAYVSGTQLKKHAQEARTTLNRYLDDKQIEANMLTYGPDINQWDGLNKEQKTELIKSIGQRIHVLALQVRLNNPAYRNSQGSDLWQAHTASDVFATIVQYPGMTGSEDEGNSIGVFGQIQRMVDDLARIRDTMRNGRSQSALIWLDAPVQGRKNVADLIAIKQWLALGGWYVSPMVSSNDVTKHKAQMEEERELTGQLQEALLKEDFPLAERIYKKIQALAKVGRFSQASEEFDRVKQATQWYRGAGFNNLSVRHQYYYEAWSKIQRDLPLSELDLGTFMIVGLMHNLNGKSAQEITETLTQLKAKMDAYRASKEGTAEAKLKGFSSTEAAEIMYLFVKPQYEELSAEQVLTKGESSSLKPSEGDSYTASGQAHANYMARQKAQMLAERVKGYQDAQDEVLGKDFNTLDQFAQEALGKPDGVVSNEAFGRFLAFTEAAFNQLIKQSALKSQEKTKMKASLKSMIDGGNDLDVDKWGAFMGKGDDIGSIGRLALAAKGDKKILRELARAGGKMDIFCALLWTLEFNQMPDTQVNKLGLGFISSRVAEQTGEFFSRTTYDHTAQYFPSWMHPAKSGNGFTNYDAIMGDNLGPGAPLTMKEVFQLAVENHQWLDQYFGHLLRTKTELREKSSNPEFVDAVLGVTKPDGQMIAPIGVDSRDFTELERQWYTYTQKREFAFLVQQGHHITGVFNDFDPDLIDGKNRPNILMSSPIGRSHLAVFLAELEKYNRTHPNKQVNVIISRADQTAQVQTANGSKKVMTIENGLMYLDQETYVKARVVQLIQRGIPQERAEFFATKEAEQALKRNPNGIVVAVRFKEALVKHLSVPFHGGASYQRGDDEEVGLTTTQSWLHNLFPGYAKTFEHLLYKGQEDKFYYPPEFQWYKKYQYEGNERVDEEIVIDRILNGYQGFPGLRKIKWLRGISKPSRQSGGRGAIPMQLRKQDGSIDEDQLREFARQLAQEGYKDDQVLQKFMSSSPYLWASPELIAKIRAGLIKKGIALPKGAPLFVYSRIIVNYKNNDPEQPVYSLEMVVSSRMAVSNVGLGGVLFKWQESFTDLTTLQAVMADRREVSALGMKLIEKSSKDFLEKIMLAREAYIQKHVGEEQVGQEYDDFHRSFPELVAMKPRLDKGPKGADGLPADLTGWPYHQPRYIMHDMLDVPIVRLPSGETIIGPDVLDVKLKDDGSLDYFVILDTREEGNWKKIKVTKDMITGWRAVTIEHNIGYGLWQPFTADEKGIEQARAKKEERAVDPLNWGDQLREMLEAWRDAAWAYKNSLGGIEGEVPTAPAPAYEQTIVEVLQPLEPASDLQKAIATIQGLFDLAMLSVDHLNLILEEFTLNHLITQNGSIEKQREDFLANPQSSAAKIQEQVLAFLEGKSADLRQTLPGVLNVDAQTIAMLLRDKEYLGYITAGVVNRIFTESKAPSLLVSANRWSAIQVKEAVQAGFNYFLVFDSLIGLMDEADHLVAAAASHEGVNPKTNVMMVLTSWINPYTGKTSKAIIYDRKAKAYRLVSLSEPMLPNRVQVMRLGTDEMKTHQKLSAIYSKLGIDQVNANTVDKQGNPLSAAAIADHKMSTTEHLTNLVDVPQGMLIKSGQSHFDYLFDLKRFLLGLLDRNQKDVLRIRIKPNTGTEGQGQSVFEISREHVLKMNRKDALVLGISQMNERIAQDLLIVEEVGNVRLVDDETGQFINRRVTFRGNVTFSYPGRYSFDSGYAQVGASGSVVSSKSQGGEIMSIQEALAKAFSVVGAQESSLVLTEEEFEEFKLTAIRALEGINRGLAPNQQLHSAGIDIEIEVDQQGRKRFYVLDVNPRPTGLRHAQSVNAPETIPVYQNLWAAPTKESDIPQLIMQIIEQDLDESHDALFSMIKDDDTFTSIADAVKAYLSKRPTGDGDSKLLLKQERAILLLGDLIWTLKRKQQEDLVRAIGQNLPEIISQDAKTRVDLGNALESEFLTDSQEEYLKFINPFLMAANQRELQDFKLAIEDLTRSIPKPQVGSLRFLGEDNAVHSSKGPMRVGISSANASDAWTAVKLRGGVVLNAAINLGKQIPVQVQIAKASAGQIELEIIGGLEGPPKRIVLNRDNITAFYTFQDAADPFRMLKYALLYAGIVQDNAGNPQQVLEDVARFTGGQGLKIRITSFGPSRSGFASSSSVAINLLHALYKTSGQEVYTEDKTLLGSMALLFENQLNLKSGRQDVDGPIFPLIKAIRYRKTAGFVAPLTEDIRILDMNAEQLANLQEHFMLVDTGIPRTASTDVRRGLNMRYLAYLSRRNTQGFDAIEKSFGSHRKIVAAFESGNWPALGQAFLEYMSLREKIDPGATWSKFDEEAGEKVLRRMFDPLVQQGLIHGGMYTGAMGGGVSMLVLTDKGREVVQEVEGKKIRRIDIALEMLQKYESSSGIRPFGKLRQVAFSFNKEGTQAKVESEMLSFEDAVATYERNLAADRAMSPSALKSQMLTIKEDKAQSVPGGIDFNSALLDLQIKRDDKGIPLPLIQQSVQQMKIDGFLPVIIKITPTNLPLLLGANTLSKSDEVVVN